MIHCAIPYFYLVAELRLHCLWECLLSNGLLCPLLMATTMAIQTLANVATLYRPLLCPILVKSASGMSTSIGSLKGCTPVVLSPASTPSGSRFNTLRPDSTSSSLYWFTYNEMFGRDGAHSTSPPRKHASITLHILMFITIASTAKAAPSTLPVLWPKVATSQPQIRMDPIKKIEISEHTDGRLARNRERHA